MTPEEKHRLIQSVVAYGVVRECAEGFSDITLSPTFAQCLMRLLDDAEYREIAVEAYQDWMAQGRGGQILTWLKERDRWERRKEQSTALPTGDTPPTSKT